MKHQVLVHGKSWNSCVGWFFLNLSQFELKSGNVKIIDAFVYEAVFDNKNKRNITNMSSTP